VLFIGILYSYVFPGTIETIGSKFNIYNCAIRKSSVVLSYTWAYFSELLPYSIVIAFLSGVGTFLGAKIVEDTSGIKHNNNAELINIGLIHMVSCVFCMMPASCDVSMTAAHSKAAKTNIALLFHIFSVFMLMTVLSSVIINVSTCCFAAIVIPFGLGMIYHKEFLQLSREGKMIFLVTMITSVMTNVVYAVLIGSAFDYFINHHVKKNLC
jgi:SulP family sulfate permease